LIVVHSKIHASPPDLQAAEIELGTKVSPLRVRQFATGRYLSRKAIELAGGSAKSIVATDARGIPIWPDGLTGSISHTATDCVVAVASQDSISSVGIDLETNEANFSRNEWDLVSSETERRHSKKCYGLSSDQFVNLIFSAKEAVYKCLAQVAEIELGFEDVECCLRPDEQGFNARLLIPDRPMQFPSTIPVDYAFLGRHVLTLAWLGRDV
jgi:4'-phosphopantetheinyl transferase EntD